MRTYAALFIFINLLIFTMGITAFRRQASEAFKKEEIEKAKNLTELKIRQGILPKPKVKATDKKTIAKVSEIKNALQDNPVDPVDSDSVDPVELDSDPVDPVKLDSDTTK